MSVNDEGLETNLEVYATFLRKKDLVLLKHQTCLVRRVRESAVFVQAHSA